MARMRVVKGEGDAPDDLYRAAPSDFTRVRDALVRRMRSAGQDSIAAAIQRLRKPTITIWALNQAARKGPANVKAYLAALERVKRAQLRQPNDLASASEAMRTMLGRIVGDARDALQAAGTAWTPAMIRRVSETLRGAGADPVQRDRLLHGRLTEELTAPGFDVFGTATPTGERRPVKAAKKPTAVAHHSARDDMMRRRAAELERESQEREREAARAESDAHQARARLHELEERANAARRKATEASQLSVKAGRSSKTRL